MDDLQEKINLIKESILVHARESWGGDPQKANRYFKKYTKDICELFQVGDGLDVMLSFLEDDDPAIKSVGAYYLLPRNTKIAEKTLKSIFNVQTFGIGTNAQTTYSEWKNGRLKFPALENGKIVYKDRSVFSG
jgi:hypothetical protein